MSYFETWQKKIEDTSNPTAYNEFVQQYYLLEAGAYDIILSENRTNLKGKAAEMAKELGFGSDMIIFTGFLDGIQSSLKNSLDLESIEDDTEIDVEIDFEKLYWQMHDAKADWLYNLESWENVICEERRNEIAKEYRTSKIVRHEKIGRNDPCPCGSGKKYKACCAKNQGAKA